MDAGDLAPLVTEFARHLTALGHTSLTVSGYDAAARHLAQWLTLAKVAVTDIDDGVTDQPGSRPLKHYQLNAELEGANREVGSRVRKKRLL